MAHNEIDLKNSKSNEGNSGFTFEERGEDDYTIIGNGFTDTFRYFYPDREGAYTWWSLYE